MNLQTNDSIGKRLRETEIFSKKIARLYGKDEQTCFNACSTFGGGVSVLLPGLPPIPGVCGECCWGRCKDEDEDDVDKAELGTELPGDRAPEVVGMPDPELPVIREFIAAIRRRSSCCC